MKLTKKFSQLTAFSALLLLGTTTNLFAAASLPPDLEVKITQGGESVTTGSIFSYIIVITNIGGELAANNAVLDVILPTAGTVIGTTQDGDTCLQTGTDVSCPLGNLNDGDQATVEIQFQAPNTPTLLSLTAEASESGSAGPETNFDNNSATVETEVVTDDDGNNVVDNNGGCSLGTSGNFAFPLWHLASIAGLIGLRWTRRRS